MTNGTPLLQQIRRSGLIALMVFVFAGVPVVQASPLHDHAQHTLDCGLWHVPAADAPTQLATLLPDHRAQGPALPPLAEPFPQNAHLSPYQGRAPPIRLS